jgi:hypothetical protein
MISVFAVNRGAGSIAYGFFQTQKAEAKVLTALGDDEYDLRVQLSYA